MYVIKILLHGFLVCIRYVFPLSENITHSLVALARLWNFLRSSKRIICTRKPCNNIYLLHTSWKILANFPLNKNRISSHTIFFTGEKSRMEIHVHHSTLSFFHANEYNSERNLSELVALLLSLLFRCFQQLPWDVKKS